MGQVSHRDTGAISDQRIAERHAVCGPGAKAVESTGAVDVSEASNCSAVRLSEEVAADTEQRHALESAEAEAAAWNSVRTGLFQGLVVVGMPHLTTGVQNDQSLAERIEKSWCAIAHRPGGHRKYY